MRTEDLDYGYVHNFGYEIVNGREVDVIRDQL